MSTVNKEIADIVIAGNGFYPGDFHLPPVVRIVTYTNNWGGKDYALIYQGEPLTRYHDSPACHDVDIVWERSND